MTTPPICPFHAQCHANAHDELPADLVALFKPRCGIPSYSAALACAKTLGFSSRCPWFERCQVDPEMRPCNEAQPSQCTSYRIYLEQERG